LFILYLHPGVVFYISSFLLLWKDVTTTIFSTEW